MLYKLFFSSVFVCCITQAKIKFETGEIASNAFKNAPFEFKNKLDKPVYVKIHPLLKKDTIDQKYVDTGFKVDAKTSSKESDQGYLRISSENFDPSKQIEVYISYVARQNFIGGNADFVYLIEQSADRKKIYVTFEKSFFSSKPALRPQTGKKMKVDGKEIQVTQSELPLNGNVTKKAISAGYYSK